MQCVNSGLKINIFYNSILNRTEEYKFTIQTIIKEF